MTERVGGVAGRAHLEFLESFGYELSIIDRTTGSLTAVGDNRSVPQRVGATQHESKTFVAVHSDANNGSSLRPAQKSSYDGALRSATVADAANSGEGEFRLCTSARSDTYFDQLTEHSLPSPVSDRESSLLE